MAAIVTNVVNKTYPIKVYAMRTFKRKGGLIDQFTVEAESSECAKLKAESMVESRIRLLYNDDFKTIIEVCKPQN